MAFKLIISIIIGYLLGSISPAYLIGRIAMRIDIREVGYKNAGTRNVYHILGLLPAIGTGFIDTTKGLLAVLIALYIVEITNIFVFIPAFAAVVGHIFPFYLNFKGGRGLATAVGIYLFYCIYSIYTGAFSIISFAAILIVALLMFISTKNGDITGLVSWTFLAIQTPLEMGFTAVSLLMFSLSLFLLSMSIRNCIRFKLFQIEKDVEIKLWKIIARPIALLLIPIDIIFSRTVLLFIPGALALIFIAVDIIRLFTRLKRFSSITGFLVSIFIIFLVFPDNIPYLSLTFITIGAMFSKLIGIRFGRKPIFKDRTLQGTIGFLAGSFMFGYFLYTLLPIPLLYLIAGSVFAAIVELFSRDFDDTFIVGILSGGFLSALRYFLHL